MNTTEIRHGHLFCGLGGGAKPTPFREWKRRLQFFVTPESEIQL